MCAHVPLVGVVTVSSLAQMAGGEGGGAGGGEDGNGGIEGGVQAGSLQTARYTALGFVERGLVESAS